MLAVSRLTVRRGPCPVVSGVDLEVAPGEVVALIGPNGAGKSTVLKGILGLLPAEGTVRVDDRPLAAMDTRERARRLGYVPQRSQLTFALPVAAVVAQGRFAYQGQLTALGPTDRQAVDAALARTDATHLATRLFTQLSAGEQQRVLLARALATGARTVLLDEPTAALDIGHALALLDLLRELAASGQAVLVVLHDLDQVARVADRVVLLAAGQVVVQGPVADVLTAERLAPVFGVVPVPGGALGFAPATPSQVVGRHAGQQGATP
jgi:iron complex transport system ATP-binding protein